MLLLALMSAVALEPAIQTTGFLDATPETYRALAVRPISRRPVSGAKRPRGTPRPICIAAP